ncbi:5-deoxy-glucuronate isomerase, partial [bacterium M00.F.Ca.ET.180.01.1.1]
MSKLLVKAAKGHGRVAHVTPQSAGWTYVGFDLHRLKPGESASGKTG